MKKKLYAVININQPGFISYLSLSSDKKNCKKRFITNDGPKPWKFAKQLGYRVKPVLATFEIK